ncbi:hypothetical protein CLOM_g20204 [Closterium sp. NIES-68]|nr:hypothetical protein CLOM_g20204 [Closterium sp. NIES-68]GJP77295.1 hypothetical protein CLOP_g7712 [Closterium sp. NIES-67]
MSVPSQPPINLSLSVQAPQRLTVPDAFQEKPRVSTPAKASAASLRNADGSIAISVHATTRATFSAEKARLLRQKMRESESYHDTMYHSGLASRLA